MYLQIDVATSYPDTRVSFEETQDEECISDGDGGPVPQTDSNLAKAVEVLDRLYCQARRNLEQRMTPQAREELPHVITSWSKNLQGGQEPCR